MGYVRKPRAVKITWDDDSELHGLEIHTRGVSTGKYLEINGLWNQANDTDSDEDWKAVFGEFAGVLTSWNLEVPEDDKAPDGPVKPVPATLDGLLSVDIPFVAMVIMRWLSAMTGVGGDLGKDSASGDPSLEESMPMEPLSPNLRSLPA